MNKSFRFAYIGLNEKVEILPLNFSGVSSFGRE